MVPEALLQFVALSVGEITAIHPAPDAPAGVARASAGVTVMGAAGSVGGRGPAHAESRQTADPGRDRGDHHSARARHIATCWVVERGCRPRPPPAATGDVMWCTMAASSPGRETGCSAVAASGSPCASQDSRLMGMTTSGAAREDFPASAPWLATGAT